MKLKKYIISIALLVLIVLPAIANQWFEIHDKRYIDLGSVKVDVTQGKKFITVWIKNLNPGDWKPFDNQYVWYIMSPNVYNCSDRTVEGKYVAQYGLKDKYLFGTNLYVLPTPVIPQSTGETTLNTLCKMY